MATTHQAMIALERRFWQSMVDQDTDAALALLNEPALMVSAYGAMKFDHEGYRKMADQGSKVVTAFDLQDVDVVFPNENTAILTYRVRQTVAPRGQSGGEQEQMTDSSTWVRSGDAWKCVMHTETPAQAS